MLSCRHLQGGRAVASHGSRGQRASVCSCSWAVCWEVCATRHQGVWCPLPGSRAAAGEQSTPQGAHVVSAEGSGAASEAGLRSLGLASPKGLERGLLAAGSGGGWPLSASVGAAGAASAGAPPSGLHAADSVIAMRPACSVPQREAQTWRQAQVPGSRQALSHLCHCRLSGAAGNTSTGRTLQQAAPRPLRAWQARVRPWAWRPQRGRPGAWPRQRGLRGAPGAQQAWRPPAGRLPPRLSPPLRLRPPTRPGWPGWLPWSLAGPASWTAGPPAWQSRTGCSCALGPPARR